MFAQSNKSTATLLIFLKLLGDLFEKSGIALEFFRKFWSLVSLVRPRAGRNLEVGTPATTYLTDPRACRMLVSSLFVLGLSSLPYRFARLA